jgi:hypothetical protein
VTLPAIWAEQGVDKEKGRSELLDDIDWYEANGLLHPLVNYDEPIEDPEDQEDEDNKGENEIMDEDKR